MTVVHQFGNLVIDENVYVAVTYQALVQYGVDVPDGDPLWTGHGLASLLPWKQSPIGFRFRQRSEPISRQRRGNVLNTVKNTDNFFVIRDNRCY